MAYELEISNSIAPISIAGRLKNEMISRFHAWSEKRARKQSLKLLSTHDERILEDIGLQRSDLVEELGYDPSELPRLLRASAYNNPYLWNDHVMNSDHARRRLR